MEFQLIVLNAGVTFVIVAAVCVVGALKRWTVPIYPIKMSVMQVILWRSRLSWIDNNSH